MEEEISKPILSNIIVATRKENNVGEIVTEYPSELGEDERLSNNKKLIYSMMIPNC